ncbi:glycosyltransferase family 87 protein [Nesterenkonia natronophila]|nr:DUF2029 domain-containing protein [Nesterenkonia natronophila]
MTKISQPMPADPRRGGETPLHPRSVAGTQGAVDSESDPLLIHLADRWGGPTGRRARAIGHHRWSAARLLAVLTSLGVLLAVLASQYCRINGWDGTAVYHWGCYSDVSALWSSRDFDLHPWAPFLDSYAPFEYPALTMLLASTIAAATHGVDALLGGTPFDYWGERTGLLYWDLTFVAGALAWFVLTMAVMRAARATPWKAGIVALSPAIIFGIGINWDIFPAAALALAVLFCLRRKWFTAGVMVGIGASFKLYPLFLLGAVLTLALRSCLHRHRDDGAVLWVDFGRVAGGGALAWALINVPIILTNFSAWSEFYVFSAERGAGWSSIWQVWGLLTGSPMSADAVSGWSFALFAASCTAVLVIGVSAPQRPNVVQLMLLIVAAFMIFNKVYSPQFMMWLVPLVVLAGLPLRDVLTWHAFQVLHFWAIWMHLAAQVSDAEPQHLFDEKIYVAAVLGHVLSTLYVCAVVVAKLFRRQSEPSAVS